MKIEPSGAWKPSGYETPVRSSSTSSPVHVAPWSAERKAIKFVRVRVGSVGLPRDRNDIRNAPLFDCASATMKTMF
jgi:hypothetical protein